MSKNLNIILKQHSKGRTKKEIVQLEGDLTINNISKIKKVILSVMNKSKSLDVNLMKVNNIDLSCIQLLYSFYKTSVNEGKAVAVNMEFSDDIKMIVRNSGFDRVFNGMNEN